MRRKWKWRSLRAENRRKRRREGTEMAARLAPLEEQEEFKRSKQSDGNHTAIKDTIRVDSSSVKMPGNLLENERDAASTFRLDPVVVVILTAMLAFIAFIAWQITLMPEAGK